MQDVLDPSVTHVVVGDKPEGLARFNHPVGRARVVASGWLEDCLSKQARMGEGRYLVDVHKRVQEVDEGVSFLPPPFLIDGLSMQLTCRMHGNDSLHFDSVRYPKFSCHPGRGYSG